MKYRLIITFLLALSTYAGAQENGNNCITYDVDNFWDAYDKIKTTQDSVQQYEYINSLFIEKGSAGLKAIMKARRYTPASYVNAINNYPLFWASVRENTYKAKDFAKQIEIEINNFKTIYPDLKPATIYFTIGALKTNGTTLDGVVLIGSELALADENTVSDEFPNTLGHLKTYFSSNPIKDVVFLNVHEYVHTQQKTTVGTNLLSQCLIEGVAEFIAEKVTGKSSITPAVTYGKNNNRKVKERFVKEMFSRHYYNWLWNDTNNDFKIRDLGYYVGYAIAEHYYDMAADKKQAIREMITLEYDNAGALESFVNRSGYFGTPVQKLKAAYENGRPEVSAIAPFKNGAENVSSTIRQVTITFSTKMDTRFRGFDYGPLGESGLLRVNKFIGFSDDGKSAMIEVALKQNQKYQVLITDNFRSAEGIPLKPYLIEFKTE
ncbi:DUF2268 domain-containing putative Zn-dependent protease [Chryseosolibacter indicus]|uniref:DUF2268 domain-containing protein n=1 Tax=Chryseosolibacter indicus TaxID=2782351 RepID=A0ABS5VQW0_9BACT|nr:DUF2268 domain-containing putative Zn-dependent protease [Chryseosolibacter indicus]MBT1703541.1 hypothetical protein [Chryseosolibacter indicus]